MGENNIRYLFWLGGIFFHTNKGIPNIYGIRGFRRHGNGYHCGKEGRAKNK
jgi:hypothetical protein